MNDPEVRITKYGCGCIGFPIGGVIIVIERCDYDRCDETHFEFSVGNRRILPENIHQAVRLSEEESTEILNNFRKQLANGYRFEELKRLLS